MVRAFPVTNMISPFVYGLLLLQLSGCGGGESVPKGTVEGTFTVGGKVRTDLAITFMGLESGHAANAVPDENGNFEINDELPVGDYVVFIAPKPVELQTEADMKPIKIDVSIPEKYWNETTSDLRQTIAEGVNQCTIDVPAS